METIALYIGYTVMVLIVIALVVIAFVALRGIFIDLYKIYKYKRIIRYLTKQEQKDIYKASMIAVQFLISKGISPYYTLQEAISIIEKYRKLCETEED